MSGLDIAVYTSQAAALAAASAMVFQMGSCRLVKRFPFLAAYMAVAMGLIANRLFTTLAVSQSASAQTRIFLHRFEFYTWLTLAVAATVLAVIVVIELQTHFLAPYSALQRVAEKTLRVGLGATAAAVALGVLAAPGDAVATMRRFIHFEGAVVGLALVVLCGLVALFVSHFQIEAAPNLTTILWGVGVLFGGESAYHIAVQNLPSASLGSLLVAESVLWTAVLGWIALQLQPQEGAPLATVPRHQGIASLRRLEALNEAMTRPYER